MNWSAFNPFEEEKPKTIDVKKPLAKQLSDAKAASPLPAYNITGDTQFSTAPIPLDSFSGVPQLTEEDKKKWMDYLTGIYTKARQENNVFDEFENQVEALSTVLIGSTSQQLVAAVYAIMSKKGFTKQQILDAANNVLGAVNSGKTEFDKKQANKQQELVTGPQQQITDKQQQILKLQNEIGQLTQSISEGQTYLSKRAYGFTACFNQVIAKVTQDVNISDHIQ